MNRRFISGFIGVLSIVLNSCGNPDKPINLLDGEHATKWESAGVPGQGVVSVGSDGVLKVEAGKPLSGIVYREGGGFEIPVSDYRVEFEARRIKGGDFFASLTFPIGSKETCATLVLGGWGGSLVGISCLDDRDASENFTRASIGFENGQWYRFRLVVTEDHIKVWLKDSIIIDAPIKGKSISMRPGDIELCTPFGFATYWTSGEVRNLTLTRF